MDRELTDREREEWNEIYASLRSRTILTGTVVGIDTHSFKVRDRDTKRIEYREILCAVVIAYRVKVLIPETEIWQPGSERPSHVLQRAWQAAEIDYVILDVDREARGYRLPEAWPGRQAALFQRRKERPQDPLSI